MTTEMTKLQDDRERDDRTDGSRRSSGGSGMHERIIRVDSEEAAANSAAAAGRLSVCLHKNHSIIWISHKRASHNEHSNRKSNVDRESTGELSD